MIEYKTRVFFDKQLFESKYVEPEKRVPVDTLFLIGNGFDIWQGLNTRYEAFEKYYEEHLDEVLSRLHLKKMILTDKNGNTVVDAGGNPVTYSDVELFYGDPYNPKKLPHDFWRDFETSLDKIDDQEINYFFGKDGVKNIQACANNAQRILREIFCDWVTSIEITEEEPNYDFGENALFINFNYTDTLLKRFGVKEINEYHVHGSAVDKLGYLTPEEAFLEADKETIKKLNGAEWHISYFSDGDKKKIETVMSGFGCRNYTLHSSIDECISKFKME